MTRLCLVGITLVLALNSVAAATYPNRCEPETVGGALERSGSVFWVVPSEKGDARIWIKGKSDSAVVPPEHFERQCAFLAFVDDSGKQFLPCAGWAIDYSLPLTALAISTVLDSGQSCDKECSDKFEDDVMVLNGKASPGMPIVFPLTNEERRKMILGRSQEDRKDFPDFEIISDEWGLPLCFKVGVREFQEAISERMDGEGH